MPVSYLQEYGNNLAVIFSGGNRALAVNTGTDIFFVDYNIEDVSFLQRFGDQIAVVFLDGSIAFAYKTAGTNLYYVSASGSVPTGDLIDTITPGHTVNNGSVAADWQWHLDNNSNRGGVDLDYNFQTFTAPGAGTVSHFDVSGVGMVVRLILDTPAVRVNPQLTNDQYGPMVAIWFQHCSASVDGHAEQGDIIGTSGDGYGDYGAHLHVHGLIDTGISAGSSNRCNFWGFV